MWSVKRLKSLGSSIQDLVDVYIKQVRLAVEFGVPIWNSSLTKGDIINIERVQKVFFYIIFENNYENYDTALNITKIESLEQRRHQLCVTFATKSINNYKFSKWFQIGGPNTRSHLTRYSVPEARLKRFEKSPIPYLTSLLNTQL